MRETAVESHPFGAQGGLFSQSARKGWDTSAKNALIGRCSGRSMD